MFDSHAITADDVAQLKAQLALAQKQLAEHEAENATLKRKLKTALKKT